MKPTGWISHIRQAVMCFLLLMLTACGGFGMDDQQLLGRAAEHAQKGEIQAAVIELKNILQRSPDNAEARYRLASIYLEYEDFPAAEKQFRRAGEAGWNPAESRIGLVKSMLEQGEYSAALKECVVEDAFPANAQADITALRAVALTGLEQRENALAALNAGEQLQPDAALVLQTRIDFLMAAGNTAEAAQVITRALKRYPDNAGFKLREAALLASEQDLTLADERLREIIALDPPGYISGHGHRARLALVKIRIIEQNYGDASTFIKPLYRRDTEALYLGALLAYQEDNFELAGELLLNLLKRSPGNLPAMQLYGMVSYSQENYENAAYYLSKYVSANPDNLIAKKQLNLAHMKIGQSDEAGTTLPAATDEKTDDNNLLALSIVNAFNSGDNRTGILLLERAATAAPDNLPLRSELARAYMFSGETDRAIQIYEQVIRDEPDNVIALNNLAWLYGLEQNPRALLLAENALKAAPDDPGVQDTCGWLHVQQGQVEKGLHLLEKALQQLPETPEVRYHYAVALYQSGERDTAIGMLKDLLAEDSKFTGRADAQRFLDEKQ